MRGKSARNSRQKQRTDRLGARPVSYPINDEGPFSAGHAVAQLRHRATSRKVAGSIPHGVTEIFP